MSKTNPDESDPVSSDQTERDLTAREQVVPERAARDGADVGAAAPDATNARSDAGSDAPGGDVPGGDMPGGEDAVGAPRATGTSASPVSDQDTPASDTPASGTPVSGASVARRGNPHSADAGAPGTSGPVDRPVVASASDPGDPTVPPRGIAAATVIAIVVAIAAVAAAVWFGLGWGRALVVDRAIAHDRDAAYAAAQQSAINLNTIDVSDMDRVIDDMRSSITGPLQDELDRTEPQIREKAAQSGASMNARVLFGALTSLDRDADTAQALVVLQVTSAYASAPTANSVSKVSTLVTLNEVDGTWKATTLEPLSSTPMTTDTGPAAPAPPADGTGGPGQGTPDQNTTDQGTTDQGAGDQGSTTDGGEGTP